MSELVGNPEDRFSQNEANLLFMQTDPSRYIEDVHEHFPLMLSQTELETKHSISDIQFTPFAFSEKVESIIYDGFSYGLD